MYSAVLMRENVAEKCICEMRILITTWFISEPHKSCDRKTSAQSDQKMVFKRITPHSPVSRNFFYLGLYDSGMRNWTVWRKYDQGQVRKMTAQPDQIIRFRTTIF